MTVLFDIPGVSRRVFLGTAAAAAGTAVLPAAAAPKTRYIRYNAITPQGQAMLASYAVAIDRMLKLDPRDPHNWFRNAFVHAVDCPHGNWWFFAWHRPFVGYFEQVVRRYSDNPNFAFPYWDWTQAPRVPAKMFDGVLDPRNAAYAPYTSDFMTFFRYMNPALGQYWASLSPAQLEQLNKRGMPTLGSLWQQVLDQDKSAMFSTTANARWITRDHPELDETTRGTVSLETILSGLMPNNFAGFNSDRAPSHNTPPPNGNVFAILEGQPHNKTHNNVGGVRHIPDADYKDFGYMADNLSPVDPIFFLHHANMDRLWDVWTRKQQTRHLPWLPQGADWQQFHPEPFLFYVDSAGHPALRRTAGQSVDIGDFDYSYEPGSGEQIVRTSLRIGALTASAPFVGAVSGGNGKVTVPPNLLEQATGRALVAKLTIPHPMSAASPREYDVLVNAPPGTQSVGVDSPYYVGTISFFGFMPGMGMGDVTFEIPIKKMPPAAKGVAAGELVFSVVPSTPTTRLTATAGPLLKAVSVSVLP